ncbi:MAG TPA: hypothetical protein VMX38_05620 [Verrucomicrobiae bacterium]|nr:hypothetical protein [Verrucomicrobiae bacterium]
MPITIQPYLPEHEPAVAEFNQRLKTSTNDPTLVFPRYAVPRWLPHSQSSDLFQEYFLALENGFVRGGYALKHQNFIFPDGKVRRIGYYHHPYSEGIINKSYAVVGSLLLRDAMARSPLLYCLGMGGYDRPLPKMLVRLGWTHCAIPFYFLVLRPHRFLLQMQALRGSAAREWLMNLAAASGAGWAAMKALRAWRSLRAPRVESFTVEKIAEFSAWANDLWEKNKDAYALAAMRDATTLCLLYPATDEHFTRLRIRRGGQDIGWAVVGERRKDEKYGEMRVGSIIDGWAAPGDAAPVVQAATAALEQAGMDLIVSNQNHAEWGLALANLGFLSSESNFIFAASKTLAALLQPFESNRLRMHFTRADGDGLPRNF